MEILLEPVEPHGPAARALLTASDLSAKGVTVALAAVHRGPAGALGTQLWHEHLALSRDPALADACARVVASRESQTATWSSSAGEREAWVQVVLPPPAILVCGAGIDAEPLVAGLRALQYPVTVVDHRPAYANSGRFAGATVVLGSAATVAERLDVNAFFAAVVMSHHLASDAAYLRALAQSTVGYVGLLGPRARRDRVMSEVGSAADRLADRLRAPIGLDIGAVTPEGIAVAIVAEIHAVAARRAGGSIATARAVG